MIFAVIGAALAFVLLRLIVLEGRVADLRRKLGGDGQSLLIESRPQPAPGRGADGTVAADISRPAL